MKSSRSFPFIRPNKRRECTGWSKCNFQWMTHNARGPFNIQWFALLMTLTWAMTQHQCVLMRRIGGDATGKTYYQPKDKKKIIWLCSQVAIRSIFPAPWKVRGITKFLLQSRELSTHGAAVTVQTYCVGGKSKTMQTCAHAPTGANLQGIQDLT